MGYSFVASCVLRVMATAIGLLVLLAFPAVSVPLPEDLGQQIKTRLEQSATLTAEGITLDRGTLIAAYRARGYQPVWARSNMAAALADILESAGRNGIDPDAIAIGALRAALADPTLPAAARELLLTDRFLAYARILAQGRVELDMIENNWALAHPTFDPATALARLTSITDPGAALAALEPQFPEYRGLVSALKRYRALAAAGGWQPLPADVKIESGDKGTLVQSLRQRLTAEGYLPAELDWNDLYDSNLVVAVRRFQSTHGLAIDGRVGRVTGTALNRSVADRIKQIELNLERWRGMPRDWPPTRIVVNVASAELTFYRDGTPVMTSRVIVGDVRHPTPVLSAHVESVLFNPPWNVPASILRKEIEPKLKRDPGFLARNHMHTMGRDGEGRGSRVQQEPGPWNSLGRIKLELPNPFDVYLHDTPTRALFAKPVRALSHGCIRVEDVKLLASILLGEAWPVDTINRVINAGGTRRVSLSMEVPVYILYFTTYADPGGAVEFRDDLYGRDGRLASALAHLEGERPMASTAGALDPIGCPSG